MRRNGKAYWRWLCERHILGINRRNAEYILPHNPRRSYRIVDEKLTTKGYTSEAGVPSPATYAVIRSLGEISRALAAVGEKHDDFVIKPNRGSSGRGVLVLEKRDSDAWRRSDGQAISTLDIRYHISCILSGLYSLSELPDVAMIEQRVFPHAFFDDLTWKGTPDLRILLFHAIPVMAMLRLPTRRSEGRANLHQGAVGLGVGLATGKTSSGVCDNRRVSHHPDTGAVLAGLDVPLWRRTIEISQQLARRIPLAYIGVDLMLDRECGPLIVEANARPGLNIQVANSAGLRPRLDWLKQRFNAGAPRETTQREFIRLLAARQL